MNQQPDRSSLDFRGGFNIVSLIATAHAMAILPFVRKNFGVEFFGLPALFTLGMLFVLSAYDPIMMDYLLVWIVLLAIHRARGLALERRGEFYHSRYCGDSWLGGLFPGANTPWKARSVEVVLCGVIGAFLFEVSEVLGKFVLVGCFTIPVTLAVAGLRDTHRVRRMRDAAIEQRWLSARYRGRSRDE